MPETPHVALILGAGFSKCADLPLQGEFAGELLTSNPSDQLENTITSAIEEFLSFTFGFQAGAELPSLEDIFTFIDLSANSGHSLGRAYPPRRLRALRRLLIFRVFSILNQRFHQSADIDSLLSQLFACDHMASFVVLNWDIALERHLHSSTASSKRGVDYSVGEFPWDGGHKLEHLELGSMTKVAKVHGSANWVYCDNCRQIFFAKDRMLSLVIHAGLSDDDLSLLDSSWPKGNLARLIGEPHNKCSRCGEPVGPHIATFSFRKSFRTNAFTASWAAADEILSEADRWLFIGYSAPAADYEFVHLLKAAELKMARSDFRPKRIEAVVKNDPNAEVRFKTLFGASTVTVSQAGLAGYVSADLTRFLS